MQADGGGDGAMFMGNVGEEVSHFPVLFLLWKMGSQM